MSRHKLRRIRTKQWNRYINRLCRLSPETLATPAAMKFYNYEVQRFNRAQNRRADAG